MTRQNCQDQKDMMEKDDNKEAYYDVVLHQQNGV